MANPPVLLEEGIYLWLTNQDGPLAGVLTNANTYFGFLPEYAPYPSLVFRKIMTKSDTTFDGPSGFVERRYQFNFYGKDESVGGAPIVPNSGYVSSHEMQDLVRQQLDGLYGYLPNGIRLFNSMLASEVDHYDADTGLYTAITDYRMQFLQT